MSQVILQITILFFKGKYGVNARGTMFGQIGYSISISNGEYKITNDSDIENNILYFHLKFIQRSSDFFRQHISLHGTSALSDKDKLAFSDIGRDKLKQGKGLYR